ncbi:MAG: AraC family transcriptional regulator [Mameliella sp.]|nr:AraC family transcriptional regulator [Phaeodactylibacter sp.]
MDFSRELLFFFSALGVFNAFLLTGYFLFGSLNRRFTNRYLGILMLALVIRIGKSVFLYFNHGLSESYIHIGLMGCLVIGPAVYFFTKSQIEHTNQLEWKFVLHLLPVLGLAIYAEGFQSYRSAPELWRDLIRTIYLQWGIYVLLSLGRLLQLLQRRGSIREPRWTLSVVIGVFLIWLAYMTSSMTSYIVGALIFSFVVYLLVSILVADILKPGKSSRAVKAKENRLIDQDGSLKERLDKVLIGEGLYKDPNLTMPQLAKAVQLAPHQLSALLNQQFGQSFPQYINTFRVQAAKEQLIEQDHLTVEAIAYASGFNSTSTFYSAFKRETGQTPAAFRKSTGR